MAKDEKDSSTDKEDEKNEKKLPDKNILPPKVFSSHSQNKAASPEKDSNQKAKTTENTESKNSEKTDGSEVKENDDTGKNAGADTEDKSKQAQKVKTIRFEDDVLAELKREFPSSNLKSREKDEKKDEEGEPDTDQIVHLDRPKARARSNAIKRGLSVDQELPDMASQDIVVEKGGPSIGQNLMGQKGFVSSLLFDVISKQDVRPPLSQSKSKPVSKQSMLERKSTLVAVGSVIQDHFEKKSQSKSMTFLAAKKNISRSKSTASGLHLKAAPESKVETTMKSDKLPPELQHLKSGWEPASEVATGPQVGFRQRKQSWVGTYVDGTDYWSKGETTLEQEEVPFELDRRGQTWYDLPVAEQVQIEIPTETKRTLSRAKFEAVKMKSSQELAESADEEKKRLFSFDDREPIPEKISSDLYQMFLEFCKTDDLSSVQNRLSLLNADRSLEKVGLLDHKKLTMIHTGLCFKAAGGSRYRGLTFAQYKLFIEMVAETRKIPVFDFVNRLKLGYAGIIILPEDAGAK